MSRSSDQTRILEPVTIPELLAVYADQPKATIVAGGTYLLSRQRGVRFPTFGPVVISIARIDELKRISRSERYVDIGAAAPISSILAIGSKIVPELLLGALRGISSQPVRNLATLGGNLCVTETRLSTFAALLLLEAKIELRRVNRSRWVPLGRFVLADGTLGRAPGEVCTRIRVPLVEWNIQEYRTIAPATLATGWNISFCGVADTTKGMLADFRFVFGSMGKTVLRNREIEAALSNRKLPLTDRDREGASNQLELSIDSVPPGLSVVQRQTAMRYLDWFLMRLGNE